ncbi:MAG: AAA family ATPase [Desulfobacteraceae bacterium]|nr:AAA family ATPase [Desulfobacteraceae bacterium]MBC2758054.1 AAA family ATPase [Desulfobacteraceae bacterium]
MKCPKCQFDNRESAKFCLECGDKLERTCPECKKALPHEAKFCDECGYNLKKPEQAPPLDFTQPQSYTPKFLADKILTSRSSIEGERKLVTVLFADVANYTAISEKIDPEEIHQIMDGCFKILMDEIHKYEGTINQFTGDGVMALFGAPIAHEDHAQRACFAALSILKSLETYGGKVKKDFGEDFKMRIGLNSGPVIVGSIGDDLRMDYTAIGDTVNLASRMESTAEPGSVMVSKNTYKITGDFFEFKPMGKVSLKGKKDPQEAFKLIKKGVVETRIGASAAKGLTRFVGRKNSIAGLMEAYEKVQSGSGQVLGIVGEAGVGKSRIILELKNKIHQDENTWLEGRSLHYGSSIVYLPLLDILKSYFDIKEGDREYIIKKKIKKGALMLDEKLGCIIPPFHELLSLKSDDESFVSLEPKDKREKTFEALRDLFIRESQNKPLILVIEDLHWIDKTSEEFINYLIGWLTNSPIMLILLYRPEYTHQWGSKSYYTKIGLQQLGTASSIELVQAILEGADVVPELKDLILNRAAGNPLFMEEFTHTLLENGSIQRKNNKYVLIKNAANIDVPDTIQGIIAARMDRLEDNLKRTMQVASVIGRDFAFRILHTITGMHEDLKSCLLNLQGLEFIYEKNLFPELEYIFKHALIQEVAYNSLLIAKRKEFHEKIGKAIEDIYVERLEEFYEMLAYHYSKSDNFEKAYHYLKLSGEKASGNYSVMEAFSFYNEALNFLNRLQDSKENKRKKLELIYLMLKPSLLLGLPENCLQILREGETLASEFNDKKSLAQFYGVLGQYYAFKGKQAQGFEYAEKCVHLAKKIQDIELMVINTLSCYYATQYTGDFEKLTDIASKTIKLLEQTKKETDFFGRPANPYCFLCAECGLTMGHLGEFNIGEALCEKGLRVATEIDDALTIATVETVYSLFFCHKGNGKIALKHAETAVNLMEKINIGPLGLGLAYGALGWSYLIAGNHKACQKYGEKGLKMTA